MRAGCAHGWPSSSVAPAEARRPICAACPGRDMRPVVQRETTNLGPEVDDAVFDAKRRMRIGADPDYDLVYENFDVLHYLLQSPRLLRPARRRPRSSTSSSTGSTSG